MSAPQRMQVPDEPELTAHQRAEAEAAIADLMAFEERKARIAVTKERAIARRTLDLPSVMLVVSMFALVYLIAAKPAWIILPIPANGAMFQFYRESWRAAIDERQHQVHQARLRREGFEVYRAPAPIAKAPTHLPVTGYLARGDSYRTAVIKTLAFEVWMLALGGR